MFYFTSEPTGLVELNDGCTYLHKPGYLVFPIKNQPKPVYTKEYVQMSRDSSVTLATELRSGRPV